MPTDEDIKTHIDNMENLPEIEFDDTKKTTIFADDIKYLLAKIEQQQMPVGTIYYNSQDDTNPGILLGYGFWERVYDRFMYAAGLKSNGTLGGSEEVTLTAAQMPSHRHTMDRARWFGNDSSIGSNGSIYGTTASTTPYGETIEGSGSRHLIGYTGGGQAHDNMPPYMVVYCWVRQS